MIVGVNKMEFTPGLLVHLTEVLTDSKMTIKICAAVNPTAWLFPKAPGKRIINFTPTDVHFPTKKTSHGAGKQLKVMIRDLWTHSKVSAVTSRVRPIPRLVSDHKDHNQRHSTHMTIEEACRNLVPSPQSNPIPPCHQSRVEFPEEGNIGYHCRLHFDESDDEDEDNWDDLFDSLSLDNEHLEVPVLNRTLESMLEPHAPLQTILEERPEDATDLEAEEGYYPLGSAVVLTKFWVSTDVSQDFTHAAFKTQKCNSPHSKHKNVILKEKADGLLFHHQLRASQIIQIPNT
eukprot:g8582.t1